MLELTETQLNNFWDKVVKKEGCWEWTASTTLWGYGLLGVNGRIIGAHRISYEIHKGSIPEGLWILHTCDNPPCTNPEHLYLGTQKDNAQDRTKRGRNNSFFSKLTHCRQGHEYTTENTYVKRGKRNCRTCQRVYDGRYKAKTN